MTRRTNIWAKVLWVGAALVAAAHAIYWIEYGREHVELTTFKLLSDFLRYTAFDAGMLAGLGALIDLVDQVRWDLLHKPE